MNDKITDVDVKKITFGKAFPFLKGTVVQV
jgi:hypothetical protein